MRQRNLPIPGAKIFEALDGTANLSCKSNGQPLSLCIWSHTVKGQLEVNVLDRYGENFSTNGIGLSSIADLNTGECSLTIESITKDDFGVWTCTLAVAAGGQVLTGQVELCEGEKCDALNIKALTNEPHCFSSFNPTPRCRAILCSAIAIMAFSPFQHLNPPFTPPHSGMAFRNSPGNIRSNNNVD